MAVSVDEGKAANRLRPVYNMNGWTFEAYSDLIWGSAKIPAFEQSSAEYDRI